MKNYPKMLKCGHLDFSPAEENLSAIENDGMCCANTINRCWRTAGLSSPVPNRLRRLRTKEAKKGFMGLCVSQSTGFYIGGLANDCRHNGTDEFCEVHDLSYVEVVEVFDELEVVEEEEPVKALSKLASLKRKLKLKTKLKGSKDGK